MDINKILQSEADNQRIPVFLLAFFTTQKTEFWIFFDLPKKILRFFLTMYSQMQQYAYMTMRSKSWDVNWKCFVAISTPSQPEQPNQEDLRIADSAWRQ